VRAQRGSIASQRTAAQIAQISTSSPATAAPIIAPVESLPEDRRACLAPADVAGAIVMGRPGTVGVVVAVADPGVGIEPGAVVPVRAVGGTALAGVLVVVGLGEGKEFGALPAVALAPVARAAVHVSAIAAPHTRARGRCPRMVVWPRSLLLSAPLIAPMLIGGCTGSSRVDGAERLLQHGLGGLLGVEHVNPAGVLARERLIGGGDLLEEAVGFALEPVRGRALSERGGAASERESLARGGCGDAQQQSAVGQQILGGEQVERQYLLHAQAAAGSLVGERGVHEAVEQHCGAFGEQRSHALVHELGARRRVQEGLGTRPDGKRGVLDERADLLGERHTAGLAQQLHRLPALAQALEQGVCERRLAGAVDPLDRDQPDSRHRPQVSGRPR
jgi:hypothetical protein